MLELKEFVRFFLVPQRLMALAAALVLGAVLGWGIRAAVPQGATMRVELARSFVQESVPANATIDGYYLVETSRMFSERLGALLRDERVRGDFTKRSGAKIIRAERETAFTWTVGVVQKQQTRETPQQALEILLSEALAKTAQESGEYVQFQAIVSEPYQSSAPLTPLYAAIAGAGIAVILVIFLQLSVAYFRNDRV